MTASTNRRTLSTTTTSLEVIETLKEMDGARVTELAQEMDRSPSTVHSHLATLEASEYLVKEGDVYELGLEFLELGEYVRRRNDDYAIAESKVEQLAEETGGRAHFVVEEHGKGVYVYTQSGQNAVETFSREGRRFYLHQAAAGKAILAYLPRPELRTIVDRHGLPGRTNNTITDPDALADELEAIRERNGVAFNLEEQIRGIRAVGAPIRMSNGAVVGGLSLSGPTHRLKGERLEEEIPEAVLGTANELELEIEYD